MCVWFIGYRLHPRFPLVLSGNRDEFFSRPTRPADFYPDLPGVLAGRDELAGGTWMGVTRSGRFALLTNYRDPASLRPDARSRGRLVLDYLAGGAGPGEYLKTVVSQAPEYNSFNLLAGTPDELFYVSDRKPEVVRVGPGVHGISNALLDTPWPKVEKGKSALPALVSGLSRDRPLETEPFFQILSDAATAPVEDLPDTGVGLEWERTLSAIFVQSPHYGTRASTVMILSDSGEIFFEERGFGPPGTGPVPLGKKQFRFRLRV